MLPSVITHSFLYQVLIKVEVTASQSSVVFETQCIGLILMHGWNNVNKTDTEYSVMT